MTGLPCSDRKRTTADSCSAVCRDLQQVDIDERRRRWSGRASRRTSECNDPGVTDSDREAHEKSCHHSDFKVDPFRYSQQMKSVGDVVVTAKPENHTQTGGVCR